MNAHAVRWLAAAMLTLPGCYTSSAVLRGTDAFASDDDAGVDAPSADARAPHDGHVAPPDVGTDASMCPVGLTDCDDVAANGCETDLSSDRDHCGACRSPCALNATCEERLCVREPIVDVAISSCHVLVLLQSGRLVGWGDNTLSALFPEMLLPERTVPGSSVPALVGDEPAAISLAAHTESTLIVSRADGALYGWGGNWDGALATGTMLPVTGVVHGIVTPPLSAVFSIWTAGSTAACAIDVAGAVSCWGAIAPRPMTASPVPIPLPSAAAQVTGVGGGGPFAARLVDGSIWMWGYDRNALFGDGGTLARDFVTDMPTRVPSDCVFVDFACGATACYAVADDGQLWWWGVEWTPGSTSEPPAVAPTPFPGLPEVAQIETSAPGALALARDGTVWRWARSVGASVTQLDLGTTEPATAVYGVSDDESASGGCARIGASGLRCWELRNPGDGTGGGRSCGDFGGLPSSGVIVPDGFE